MAWTNLFFNGLFNDNAKQDPWTQYAMHNTPPMNPFEWPNWYARGQDKTAQYKGYKDLGVEPNWRFWSDDGQSYANSAPARYFPMMGGASMSAFGSRKKKRRRGGYRIPRR